MKSTRHVSQPLLCARVSKVLTIAGLGVGTYKSSLLVCAKILRAQSGFHNTICLFLDHQSSISCLETLFLDLLLTDFVSVLSYTCE